MRPSFILASSSPRRVELLRDIGIVPDQILPANINESPHPAELPRHLAQRLAFEKMQKISIEKPDAFILAADTVVGCGRRILPKAETADEVRTCLRLLSGRRHHVYTGVAFYAAGKVLQRLVDSTVIFRILSAADIERYVEQGDGIGKAGGYAIQGQAAIHIRFISGSYSNIVGLPLYEVGQILQNYGLIGV